MSYWEHPPLLHEINRDEDEDDEEEELDIDKRVFNCLRCKEEKKPEEFYVLERCGHFFCVQCLYDHAYVQLSIFRDKKKQAEEGKEEEKGKGKEEEEEKGKEPEEADKEQQQNDQEEKQKQSKVHFEILCPLPKKECGMAISPADLRLGFETFSKNYYEQTQLVLFFFLFSFFLFFLFPFPYSHCYFFRANTKKISWVNPLKTTKKENKAQKEKKDKKEKKEKKERCLQRDYQPLLKNL